VANSRKTIKDQVYTSLNTQSYGSLSVTVKNWDIITSNDNSIVVLSGDEQFEITHQNIFDRNFNIEVIISATTDDNFDEIVSKILERTDHIDSNLSGIIEIKPVSISKSIEQGGEKPIFKGTLVYEVFYRTNLTNVATFQ